MFYFLEASFLSSVCIHSLEANRCSSVNGMYILVVRENSSKREGWRMLSKNSLLSLTIVALCFWVKWTLAARFTLAYMADSSDVFFGFFYCAASPMMALEVAREEQFLHDENSIVWVLLYACDLFIYLMVNNSVLHTPANWFMRLRRTFLAYLKGLYFIYVLTSSVNSY